MHNPDGHGGGPVRVVGLRFGPDNVSCYSGTDAGSGFISYDNLRQSGCEEVYSSIAEVDVGGDNDDAGRNSKVSLQFQAAELGWWLGGGSIAEVDVGGDNDDAGRNSKVSLQFQAAELGWWLGGGCDCSAKAECTNVTVLGGGSGYRCQCREGFVGDGFAGGGGCQKGESKSTNAPSNP
ncbi:hypothetical protein RHGRI_025470 [Rhododendron griersonianum]|uniref:EGF-like domain-containing protein n=1 Tax=Rhododendron griersonianum TaxID=479676 RepID=A0AAV6IRM1_9ERIC|nr:hypothetical protein RHGRI_025470 [Rhododendron griersonianum]